MVQSDETQSSIDEPQCVQQSQVNESEPEEAEAANDEIQVPPRDNIAGRGKETRNAPKRVRLQEDIDRELLRALQKPPNEDEAFFISITPAVQKMTDEEKLEFRMSVLTLIKDINKRKSYQPPIRTCAPGPSSASSSTSHSHQSFLLSDNSNNTSRTTYAPDPSTASSSHSHHSFLLSDTLNNTLTHVPTQPDQAMFPLQSKVYQDNRNFPSERSVRSPCDDLSPSIHYLQDNDHY